MPYKDKAKRMAYQQNAIARNKRMVKDLKASTPCADCNQYFHFSVMDFDHIRGEKRESINYLVNRNMSRPALLRELAKCELVCANCHRMRTFSRLAIKSGRVEELQEALGATYILRAFSNEHVSEALFNKVVN